MLSKGGGALYNSGLGSIVTDRFKGSLLYLLLLLLVAAVFANALPGAFIYDDVPIVRDNPLVRECRVSDVLSAPYWQDKRGGGLFRPITTLSYCANLKLHGMQPLGFHVVNLLIHLVNVLLLFGLLSGWRHDGRGSGQWFQLLVTAIFAVHPVLMESINGIVGRAELLVGSSVLLALHLFRAYLDQNRILRWLPPAAALFLITPVWFLGLLAKENAVVLPGLLFLFWLTWRRQKGLPISWDCWRPARLGLFLGFFVSLAVVFGAVVIWRLLVLDSVAPAELIVSVKGFSAHLYVALQIFFKGAIKALWPWQMQWDYSPFAMMPASSLFTLEPLFGMTIIVVAAAALVWLGNSGPLLILLWFGCSLVTVLQIVPIGVIFAERFLYLPVLALTLSSALVVGKWVESLRWRKVVCFGLGALVIALAVRTMVGNRLWQDDLNFWIYTQGQAPRSLSANHNLAKAYWRRGNLAKAEHFIRQNIALSPENSLEYVELGRALLEQGKFDEAAKAFKRMIKLHGDRAVYRDLLGLSLMGLGRLDQAQHAFEQAVSLDPQTVKYRNNLVALLLQRGELAAARPHLKVALHQRTDDPHANISLFYLLYRSGEKPAWKAQLERLGPLSRKWSPTLRQQLVLTLMQTVSCSDKRVNPAQLPNGVDVLSWWKVQCDDVP